MVQQRRTQPRYVLAKAISSAAHTHGEDTQISPRNKKNNLKSQHHMLPSPARPLSATPYLTP